jgi:hypothetical protein
VPYPSWKTWQYLMSFGFLFMFIMTERFADLLHDLSKGFYAGKMHDWGWTRRTKDEQLTKPWIFSIEVLEFDERMVGTMLRPGNLQRDSKSVPSRFVSSTDIFNLLLWDPWITYEQFKWPKRIRCIGNLHLQPKWYTVPACVKRPISPRKPCHSKGFLASCQWYSIRRVK